MSYRGKQRAKTRRLPSLPFSERNFLLFGVAMLVLIIGYWALAQRPVDGFLTMTLAPILLVLGYCVLIPMAILFAGKRKADDSEH